MNETWSIPPDPHFAITGADGVLDYVCDTARRQAELEPRRPAAIERFARRPAGGDRVPLRIRAGPEAAVLQMPVRFDGPTMD